MRLARPEADLAAFCTVSAQRGTIEVRPGVPPVRATVQGICSIGHVPIIAMDSTRFLDDLQQRISQLLAGTPAADMQKNLKALLTQQFARLDLVTREEFDTQAQVLARTREKLAALEQRLAALEAERK